MKAAKTVKQSAGLAGFRELSSALAEINKELGHEAVQIGIASKPQVTPTGILELERAIDLKGLPKGVITEVYGPQGSGKTTLAWKCIKGVGLTDGIAAFISLAFEGSDVRALPLQLGIALDSVVIGKPRTADEALVVCTKLYESKLFNLVVIDAFGALSVHKWAGDDETSQLKGKSQLLAELIRELNAQTARADAATLITRRMDPSKSMRAAAEQVIGNVAKIRLEMKKDVRGSEARFLTKVVKNDFGALSATWFDTTNWMPKKVK
jgi:recombination protein RecA